MLVALFLGACGGSAKVPQVASESASNLEIPVETPARITLAQQSPVEESPMTQDALPIETEAEPRAWRYLLLHHSATTGGSVEAIDRSHRQRRDQLGNPWLGIGYHFVIGNGNGMPDGEIEATFRWKEQLDGAHAGSRKHNLHGIGVCLIGNFDETAPTGKQMESLAALAEELVRTHGIEAKRVLRHHDVSATQCPGKLFPFEELCGALEFRLGEMEIGPPRRVF